MFSTPVFSVIPSRFAVNTVVISILKFLKVLSSWFAILKTELSLKTETIFNIVESLPLPSKVLLLSPPPLKLKFSDILNDPLDKVTIPSTVNESQAAIIWIA